MRVQHNITAMNGYRNYNNNTRQINKNLEKLSSGYKINRAGDDAAGLAISEKMRAQITGLEGAQKNAKDGISLVQTAEGALTEVHSMLNRMYSLAEQSANGTYDNKTDRAQLQKEVESLRTEIDRIADSANFNGIKLLDGSLAGGGGGTTSTATVSADSIKNIDTHKINAVKDERTVTASIGSLATAWADGNEVHLDLGLSDGSSLNLTLTASVDDDGVTKLIGDDGNTYGTIAATASGGADAPNIKPVTDAFVSYLKTTSLNENYKITNDSNTIKFEAREAGTQAVTVAAATAYAKADATAGSGTLTDGVTITTGKEGANDITTFKASDLKAFTGSNADDAVFTINGQKFAITNSDANAKKLDDDVTVVVDTNVPATAATGGMVTDTTAAASAGDGLNGLNALAAVIEQKTGLKVTFSSAGFKLDGATTATTNVFKLESKTSTSGTSGSGLKLQIGDTAEKFNQLNVSIGNVHASALGVNNVNIGNQTGAAAALDKIKDAINKVSDVRGTLGATQNRLEHTISNLSVMQENIQDAESTIRDTDVADEMMKYTKNSILVQSAQAMLAQANQQPQGVLQLLQ